MTSQVQSVLREGQHPDLRRFQLLLLLVAQPLPVVTSMGLSAVVDVDSSTIHLLGIVTPSKLSYYMHVTVPPNHVHMWLRAHAALYIIIL